MALHIKANGSMENVTLPTDDTRLATMQALVGGYVQLIHLPQDKQHKEASFAYMIMDEEGRMKGALPNPTATQMIKDMGGQLMAPIVGDVVLLKDDEID